MRYLSALCLAFCCLLVAQVSFSQSTASVTGYVRDAVTEEPLVGVAVQLQGTTLGSTTDTSGYYSIDRVPPDSYNITASYVGIRPLPAIRLSFGLQVRQMLTFSCRNPSVSCRI